MKKISIGKLWQVIGEKKPLMVATLFVGLLDMLVDSIGLSWTIRTVSSAALNMDLPAVYRSVGLLTAVVALRCLFASLGNYMECRVAEETALTLRRRVFRAAMGGRAEYFDAHESGDLISRLNNDVEVAKQGVQTLANGVKRIFLIVASMTGLFVWSWPFAVGLVVMAGVAFSAGAATSGSLRSTSQRYQETLARISESATNLFGGVAVIKSLGAEREMDERFGLAIDEHRTAARKRGFYVAVQQGTVTSVPYLSLATLIILAGSMALRGLLTAADAIGLVQLSSRALFPFSSLGGIWASLQQNLAALERVEEACSIPQERREVAQARGTATGHEGDTVTSATHERGLRGPRVRHRGEADTVTSVIQGDRLSATSGVPALEFRDVDFCYGQKPVLRGLSFRVGTGDKVALLGPSGSGKSTVLRLILGMYEAGSGTIFIDGRDISEMSLSVLRKMMAVVPQDPWLIPGTVRDNILLGRPDATDDQIAGAAALANAEFIDELPDGFETVLDERGGNLSGGQRQRICLARAFLKDAPLLLLDEPTSAVDTESERLIRQAVDLLTEGRTVITVAHTQAMVEKADVTVTLG